MGAMQLVTLAGALIREGMALIELFRTRGDDLTDAEIEEALAQAEAESARAKLDLARARAEARRRREP